MEQGTGKLISLQVGAPWPYRLAGPDSMQAIIEAGGEAGLRLALVLAVCGPRAKEKKALREAPPKLSITPTRDILWLAADFGAISFDAPWTAAPIQLDARPALAAGARVAAELPNAARSMVEFYSVDSRDGSIFGTRAATCSRAWWRVLATGVAAQVDRWSGHLASKGEHDRIVANGMAAYPSTADLMRQAAVVETAGKV